MGAAPSRPREEAEDWEDHFHHEYEQPVPANWAEDEQEEASVSVHLGPRLVRRLQQQRRGGAPAAADGRRRMDDSEFGVYSADLDEALPPPLSEEELESISFSLPPLLREEEEDEYASSSSSSGAYASSDAEATSALMPVIHHHHGGVSQADREFAQHEVAEVRQHFRAEQEKRSATEVEQLHKLRGLLDAMTRHHRRHASSHSDHVQPYP